MIPAYTLDETSKKSILIITQLGVVITNNNHMDTCTFGLPFTKMGQPVIDTWNRIPIIGPYKPPGTLFFVAFWFSNVSRGCPVVQVCTYSFLFLNKNTVEDEKTIKQRSNEMVFRWLYVRQGLDAYAWDSLRFYNIKSHMGKMRQYFI